MHVVVYLSSGFYAAIAATIIETLQAVNSVSGTKTFSFEFVAKQSRIQPANRAVPGRCMVVKNPVPRLRRMSAHLSAK